MVSIYVYSKLKSNLKRSDYRISPSPLDNPGHTVIKPSKEGLGVWLDPISEELIVGDLKQWAETASVNPIRIPGYWMQNKGLESPFDAKPAPGEKVILFFHGGAYTKLSAHPSSPTSNIMKGLLQKNKTVTRSFAVEYRLSVPGNPSVNPFPSALLDALAGYNYLLNVMGFSPENIIITGDSAGGNLSLALTRYIVESQLPSLPTPGALLLFSPWVNLSEIKDPSAPTSSSIRNDGLDIVSLATKLENSQDVKAFVGPHGLGAAVSNPYISPASPQLSSGGFSNFPQTFISSGNSEVLLDQIRVLKDRMIEEMGEQKVSYLESTDAIHDFTVFSFHEPQRSEAFDAISSWLALVFP